MGKRGVRTPAHSFPTPNRVGYDARMEADRVEKGKRRCSYPTDEGPCGTLFTPSPKDEQYCAMHR